MATKPGQAESKRGAGLADAAAMMMARSRELGHGGVASLEEIAEMNAPARPMRRVGQEDAVSFTSGPGQLPALEKLMMKGYQSTNKHVAKLAAEARRLRDMTPVEKELRRKKDMIHKHWGSLHEFIADPTDSAVI